MNGCDAHGVKRPSGLFRRVPVSGGLMLALGVASVVGLPILLVMTSLFADTQGIWGHLRENLLAGLLANTAVLFPRRLGADRFFWGIGGVFDGPV